MKLQNLPEQVLGHIGSFLDPKSKINYYDAISSFKKPPTAKKNPKFYCFWCFLIHWYNNLVKWNVSDGRNSFAFKLRNEFIEDERIRRSGYNWKIKKYRRRHYSEPSEEEKISLIYKKLGEVVNI